MATVLIYTVLSGDNLFAITASINASAGVTVAQIEQANPGLAPDALRIGEVIDIPGINGSDRILRYTICNGDTLSGITNALAQCAGVTVQQIVDDNPGLNADELQIGQLLNIPAVVQAAPFVPLAANMGYWDWTYAAGDPPANATMSLAFSGWMDVDTVIENGQAVIDRLVGDKYICFGGGTSSGAFTSAAIQAITTAINAAELNDYDGIAFDVEEVAANLEDDFSACFKAAKAQGFKVLVTVSHSAPYRITGVTDSAVAAADTQALMNSFFIDPNIDYIAPQLYTKGTESENDYTAINVGWPEYAHCIAAMVPSIVNASMYPDAQQYFAGLGLKLSGYVQWQQT